MTFLANYPGAIVVEAANYGYGTLNIPKAWCLHTPEEPADNNPQTPYYFHNTTKEASTTYFVSYLGLVFQCVPEKEGPYGNAVEGKPYPIWANPTINLNLQTLSVEIEGYAASIHQTMPRGSAQWRALIDLLAHRCKALGILPSRTFGHYQVSIYRSDPGQLDIDAIIEDVKIRMEEPMTPQERQEFDALKTEVSKIPRLVRFSVIGKPEQYVLMGSIAIHIKNSAMITSMGLGGQKVIGVPVDHEWAKFPRIMG